MTAMPEIPTSIAQYLRLLRTALHGADPALVQDALFDAEDYLRSELAENPDKSEAEVIAMVAGSYGAPDEVADIYRDTDARVQTALRLPRRERTSVLGRFFGVIADPRTYGSLFYLLLAPATGVFYFTLVVAGLAASLAFSVLIVGVPVVILYVGSVKLMSLVEGRLVESMLGERMPRRPRYTVEGLSIMQRVKQLFTDPRTWTTQIYFLVMLPLSLAYFSVFVTLGLLSAWMLATPLAMWSGAATGNLTDDAWHIAGIRVLGVDWTIEPWMLPCLLLGGVLLGFVILHLARGIGHMHGLMAKHLLVPARAAA